MGKKYIYYVKGMLHNTKFYKILDGKYFIIDNKCIDTSILEKLCLSYELYEEERNLDESNLKTGEEHWFAIADEKGVIINGRNK